MNKYVGEIYEGKGHFVYHEEMTTDPGTEKPVATQHKGHSSSQSKLVSRLFVPIHQRKGNDIPVVDYVRKRSLSWRVIDHDKHVSIVVPQFGKRECREMVE